MYDKERRTAALARLDRERVLDVALATGISPRTLRRWQSNAVKRRVSPDLDRDRIPPTAYAYLLGIYLGDGWLSRMPRTWRLRISLDATYTSILEEVSVAIRAVSGGTVGRVRRQGCVELSNYWRHWPAAFPQHGPGRKHERRIALAAWQQEIALKHPRELIRGLIHSDGSRYIATVRAHGREYRYARYAFANKSDDIKSIFSAALDSIGVRWTRPNELLIAVSRRAGVAALDAFVGPKR